MDHETERQQLLWLWTADSNLVSGVVAWTYHDGNDLSADLMDVPYERGVDALGDGWRLIQASPLSTRSADDAHATGVLEYEWLFERIVARPEAERP
jgi:IS1 family transposase